MQTRQITLYSYDELSKEAKEEAKKDYLSWASEMPFLEETLRQALLEELDKHKLRWHKEPILLYSLGYSQGDGLCFTGSFNWGKRFVSITHNDRYYHKNCVEIEVHGGLNSSEPSEKLTELFKKIYHRICDKIEKLGYDEIEHDQSEEAMAEYYRINECLFLSNGKRWYEL